MAFPWSDYERIALEAKAIIQDRDGKGRNSYVPFYETRCHGSLDLTGELWQRVTRILGAERIGDLSTERADLMDLINEAILTVMFLEREMTHETTAADPGALPERISVR